MRNKPNQTLVAHRIQNPASFSASSFLKIYRRRYIIILYLYFSYLFPWKNGGGIQLWKAKHCESCLWFVHFSWRSIWRLVLIWSILKLFTDFVEKNASETASRGKGVHWEMGHIWKSTNDRALNWSPFFEASTCVSDNCMFKFCNPNQNKLSI